MPSYYDDILRGKYTLNNLHTTHEFYSKWKDEWELFWRTEQGGLEYKKGRYLPKYPKETEEHYLKRLEFTPPLNICKSILESYADIVYANTIERNIEVQNETRLEEFKANANGQGKTIADVMRQIGILSSTIGHCYAFIDKGLNEQDIPFVSVVSPLNVLDWHYEKQANGQYKLVYLKMLEHRSEEYDTYRIFRLDSTDVITIPRKAKQTDLDLDIQIPPDQSFPNPVPDEISVVVVYNKMGSDMGVGVSDLNDLATMQRDIYFKQSEKFTMAETSTHPIAVVPPTYKETEVGPFEVWREDVSEQTPVDSIQTGGKQFKDPYYLESSSNNYRVFMDDIKQMKEEMYEVSKLSSVMGQQTSRAVGTIQAEQRALESILKPKAGNLQQAERAIFRLWMHTQSK